LVIFEKAKTPDYTERQAKPIVKIFLPVPSWSECKTFAKLSILSLAA